MSKYDGRKFGRLTVMKTWNTGKVYWCDCQCDCGSVVSVLASNLSSGNVKSCGCLKREMLVKQKTIHGESGTRLYNIWKAMRRRCHNPSDSYYHIYGGIGINVCKEWESFPAFAAWAKANGYNDLLTIDRIDPNGNYCPDNCRWSTLQEQARNKRDTIFVTIGNETKTLVEWCQEKGVLYSTALYRLKKQHLSGDKLFERQKAWTKRKHD